MLLPTTHMLAKKIAPRTESAPEVPRHWWATQKWSSVESRDRVRFGCDGEA